MCIRFDSNRWPLLSSLGWVGIALLTGPMSWVVCVIFLIFTDCAKYLVGAYIMWMYLDRFGERRWSWISRLDWWHWHRDYFPIRLVKTCELPPDRNYLLAVFPHGIFTFGAVTSFMTDALDVQEMLPGLTINFCTLNVVFRLPILREFALGAGFTSASEENICRILNESDKGRAVAIAVGGATEVLLNEPNRYKILLKNRKGFCKVALKNGCDLVPVYAFGESDLFEQIRPEEGSLPSKLQLWLKRVTTICPVLIRGVGPLGLFPKKVPVTVTVGKPIPVKKIQAPTIGDIEQLHDRYTKSILDLFNEHKRKYLKNGEAELIVC